jgi:translation initiation factor 1
MKDISMSKGTIVYSTDPDWDETCPKCDRPLGDCVCDSNDPSKRQEKVVYIKREVKGRGGKTVTTISNIGREVKNIQKELQTLCGAGGTVKNGIIEIQGDHRVKIKEFLDKKGRNVKLAGG